MPELPEVEVARLALEEHCVGKRIVRCAAADDTKVIDGVAPERLEASLVGRTIAAARRKGKNMWLVLDSPPHPTFQFGMAGAIHIKGVELSKYKRSAVNPTEEWPSKYSKLFVEMDDGLEFSFTDKRRFAKIRLLDNPEAAPPISELGPDALFEPIKLDEFVKTLSQKKGPIKALLLDQARIHPGQTASKISKDKCEILHQCIKEVIEESIKVGADSNQFPENWIFHSREKKPGKAFVDGKKIDFITVGGRTSAYVPELQKLDGTDSAASRSKPGKDKENDDNTKSGKGRNAPKPAKGRVKAAKGSSNKATNTSDDGDKEDYEVEEAKPAKRGRKQPARVSNTSSKNAGSIHGDEATDEVDARPAKRTKKQIEKTTKRSLKEANHEDSDEEAHDKIEAKPGNAPTEESARRPHMKELAKES
ncbi:hypothetical protein BDA96_07G105000 [Sorghum bicolor]|uniref:DNA-(apurinic or apyrimidinic site) lyase n=2 Tax=Sorghum bicolor TaxID=4558 RepID=A0A921QJN8_SORBI|nr:formamidopyrimidine-DNA glycosylase-like isoform X2 [Sorghum bicolor]KAG0523219.1 hypothetical protein BDA96_07G105000 [Sorghum bicolor]OQU80241.1 hypothetical protein SORBI_3007G098800 [Sorghum bicolor]|eukprot:XP_021320838.1 formamidopyrimidine-DNA glycosylase-like isoform X2 [Sorghum bicolor]